MMKPAYAVFIIAGLLLISTVSAAPTTGAATGISSKNLTLSATGASGDTWWEYGPVSGSLVWRTQNVTPSGGSATTTESGVPLMANTKFYFRACDSTGCGSELSATLLQVTPNPATTYGRTAENISVSGMDPPVIAGSVPEPYTWRNTRAELIFGLLLFFIFTGLWIKQREALLPTMIGLIGSGMLIYTGANGSSIGVPPEFVLVAIALVCLALTGVIVGLFKR